MKEEQSNTKYNRAIKDISVDDRPREKALKYGFKALSAAELLAILIGSGTPGESVVDLSQRILQSYDNKLCNLGKRTIGDLKRNFKGIGDAKAITILAALELGRQYAEEVNIPTDQVTDINTAYNLMRHEIGHLTHEEFWIIILNNAKRVIGKFRISQGGVSATVVDTKMVLKTAIDNLSSSIILYHNHPSGSTTPSQVDDMLTHKIVAAGKLIDIEVIDHIIICESGYYSYANEGRL
ncbi:MAG: DNA repair protein RadC [Muribaculaceae bacterium]